MSWHFSQALAGEYLRASCLDGGQSVPLSATFIDGAFYCEGKTSKQSPLSRFGMTFAPLTGDRGAELLMSYLAAFPVKPIPRQLQAKTMQTISGRKCGESWQMSLPGTYLPKTSPGEQLTQRPTTLSRWVTKPAQFPLARQTWVATTYGSGFGFVHTPTATANYAAPSMQKHRVCRNFVRAFGRPSSRNHEYLMNWPQGWSGLEPLEMGKFRLWLQQHGDYSEAPE
jgi:hypothetical protein